MDAERRERVGHGHNSERVRRRGVPEKGRGDGGQGGCEEGGQANRKLLHLRAGSQASTLSVEGQYKIYFIVPFKSGKNRDNIVIFRHNTLVTVRASKPEAVVWRV